MAALEPHDHAQINDPYFATLQILTYRHDLRCQITVRGRHRSIDTTVLVNLLASPAPSLKTGGLVYGMPHRAIGHAQSSGPSNKAGRARTKKHTHRSNGLANEQYRTIGQSGEQINHVYLKEPSVDRPRKRTMLGAIGLSVSQTSINLKEQSTDQPTY